MKINIINNKKGYASLEILVMSCIGFTLVLALLNISLNKKILIKNEIKIYENKLRESEEMDEFLNNVISKINNMQIEDLSSSEELLIRNKLNLLSMRNERFNLYLDEIQNIFVLEESINKNSFKNYYYDYELIDGFIYLSERKNYEG